MTVRLWDLGGDNHRILPQRHVNRVWSLSFSPSGEVLASGGEDETIMLWHLPGGDWFKTLRADRPYERMNIAGATGLTEAQTTSLRALGAIYASESISLAIDARLAICAEALVSTKGGRQASEKDPLDKYQ